MNKTRIFFYPVPKLTKIAKKKLCLKINFEKNVHCCYAIYNGKKL